MEYANENRMTDRDLPPERLGRQYLPENSEGADNGGGCNHTCPWSSHCADGWGLSDHPLAMVYAPCQGFHSLYDPDTALMRGTLFSELDLPLEILSGNQSVSDCGGCRNSLRQRRM